MNMPSAELSSHPLVAKAQSRWLNAAEIMTLLSSDSPLSLQAKAPDMTKRRVQDGGCLFLYDRKTCRKFRDDEVAWVTRADGRTLLEAHERLRVPDQPTTILDVYYATSKCGSLHRRVYWHTTAPADATPQPNSGSGTRLYRVRGAVRDTRVLVHYLSAADAAASALEHTSRIKPGNSSVPRQASQNSLAGKNSRAAANRRVVETGRKRPASEAAPSEMGEMGAAAVPPAAKKPAPCALPNLPRTIADLNPHIETLRNVLKRLESFRSMCSDVSTSAIANNRAPVHTSATSPSAASGGSANNGGTAKAAQAGATNMARASDGRSPIPDAPAPIAMAGSPEVESKAMYCYGSSPRQPAPASPPACMDPVASAAAAAVSGRPYQQAEGGALVGAAPQHHGHRAMDHCPEEVDDLMAMLLSEEEHAHDNSDHLAHLYGTNYAPMPTPAPTDSAPQPATLSTAPSLQRTSSHMMHEEPKDLQDFLIKQELASVVAEVGCDPEPLPLADDLAAMGLAPIAINRWKPPTPVPTCTAPMSSPAGSHCGNLPVPAHLNPTQQPKWASLMQMVHWGRGPGGSAPAAPAQALSGGALNGPASMAAPDEGEAVVSDVAAQGNGPSVPTFSLIDEMNDVDCLVCPMMGPVAWVSDTYDEPPSLSELLALNGHSSHSLGYLRDL